MDNQRGVLGLESLEGVMVKVRAQAMVNIGMQALHRARLRGSCDSSVVRAHTEQIMLVCCHSQQPRWSSGKQIASREGSTGSNPAHHNQIMSVT